MGYDHRFGHNREEGFPEYRKHGEAIGMNVLLATELQHPGSDDVSSSQVRRLLKDGHIKEANSLLSYNYTLSEK